MSATAILEPPPTSEPPPLPDEQRRYELVEGHWIERKMGARASLVGAVLIGLLTHYRNERKSGLIFDSDCGYKVFPHAPKLVRYPDVSFVRSGRLPNDEPPDGFMLIRPDLAVEIASPNDLAEELETRLMDYFRIGVPLLWVIYPRTRCVRVLRPDGTGRQLAETEELTGEEVLPGFACRVQQLFTFA